MESKCPKIRGSNCLKMGGSRCLKIGGSNCPKIGGSKCPKSKKPTALHPRFISYFSEGMLKSTQMFVATKFHKIVSKSDFENSYLKRPFHVHLCCQKASPKLYKIVKTSVAEGGSPISTCHHSWKKAGSQDPGSFVFFGQN